MAIREINLVESGVLNRRYMRRHLMFWAGCLIAVLTLIGGVFLFQAHAVSVHKNSHGSLKQLYTNLELKINKIKRYQAELETLRRQQHALETIISNQPFYQILATLADIMNQDTWITQLALNMGAENRSGTQMKLTGFSTSNDHLGNFINRLSNDPLFAAVKLQFAKESETGQIRFQINCDITNKKG